MSPKPSFGPLSLSDDTLKAYVEQMSEDILNGNSPFLRVRKAPQDLEKQVVRWNRRTNKTQDDEQVIAAKKEYRIKWGMAFGVKSIANERIHRVALDDMERRKING